MNIIGVASTVLRDGKKIHNDKYVRKLSSGTSTLTFYVAFDNQNLQSVEDVVFPVNYILRQSGDSQEVFSILETEYDTSSGLMWVSAESGGLDLLNTVLLPYDNSVAKTVKQYADDFLASTGFEVGINELEGLSRTLSWEGESTVTARLQSLANYFDGEMAYSFEIDGLTVTHRYVNFYRRRGKDIGRTLRMGVEVDKILVRRDASELATALLPTGNQITLDGMTYDDGDIYVDGKYLKSRTALDEWAKVNRQHIVKSYSSQASSQTELLQESIRKLKQLRKLQTTYTVSLAYMPDNMDIGDTISIVDEKNGIYLTARVEEITAQDSANKYSAVISDVTEAV